MAPNSIYSHLCSCALAIAYLYSLSSCQLYVVNNGSLMNIVTPKGVPRLAMCNASATRKGL